MSTGRCVANHLHFRAIWSAVMARSTFLSEACCWCCFRLGEHRLAARGLGERAASTASCRSVLSLREPLIVSSALSRSARPLPGRARLAGGLAGEPLVVLSVSDVEPLLCVSALESTSSDEKRLSSKQPVGVSGWLALGRRPRFGLRPRDTVVQPVSTGVLDRRIGGSASAAAGWAGGSVGRFSSGCGLVRRTEGLRAAILRVCSLLFKRLISRRQREIS